MKRYRLNPESKVKISQLDPKDTGEIGKGGSAKETAKSEQGKHLEIIDEEQEKLFAGRQGALLIIFQAMDTGGKDSTIKHVLTGINPQGVRVSSFKKPTELELDHHFLWRIYQKLPPKGFIGVFNRSHYEDVLVPKVLREISTKELKRRYEEIRDFERMLQDNNTRILKFFLHISKEEQKERLEARLEDPRKHWKFNPSDLVSRDQWKAYEKAYEEAMEATSTKEAPWYIIPANRKWYRNYLVGKIIADTLKGMELSFPPAPDGVDFENIKIT